MYVIVSVTKNKTRGKSRNPIVHAYGPYTNNQAQYRVKRFFAENPTLRDEVSLSVCRIITVDD